MNRRNFLKALSITATGIAVPELIMPERRFWQLDRTMIHDPWPRFNDFEKHLEQFPPHLTFDDYSRFSDGDVIAAMDTNGQTSSVYWISNGSAMRMGDYGRYDLKEPIRIGIAAPENM